jgi:hypothetical protein
MGYDGPKIERLLKYYLIPKARKKFKKKFEPQLKLDWYEDGSMHIEGKK